MLLKKIWDLQTYYKKTNSKQYYTAFKLFLLFLDNVKLTTIFLKNCVKNNFH